MAYEEAKLTGSFNAVMVPLEELHELPDNPRRGDVEAVRKSYARFGQRKPVVARHDSEGNLTVIAGNHQLKAARLLGWSELAVSIADDLSEDEAKAFALADNRTAELGTYDNEQLSKFVMAVSDDESLLAASGYSVSDLDKLLGLEESLPNPKEQVLDERYEIVIRCDDEQQQVELLQRLIDEGLNVRGLIT